MFLQLKPIPSEPEPKTQEEELSAAEAEASTAPFLVVDSTGIPSVPSEDEDFIVVERHDAIEAMAYYIAICVMDMPEAQAMTPAALQQALSQTLRVRFCSFASGACLISYPCQFMFSVAVKSRGCC